MNAAQSVKMRFQNIVRLTLYPRRLLRNILMRFTRLVFILSLVTGAAHAQGDMNCSDFSTWREAQDFFEAAGPGDPHGLDRDNDGIACEALR